MKLFTKIIIAILFTTFVSFSSDSTKVEEFDFTIVAESEKYYAVHLESKVVDLRYCVEFVSLFNANIYIFKKLECED